MGLKILLETEQGEELERILDPKNELISLLWQSDIAGTCCLRFIDPYGNTIFNRQQMETFIAELEAVDNSVAREDQKALLHRVGDLARRCAKEVHVYMIFRGD